MDLPNLVKLPSSVVAQIRRDDGRVFLTLTSEPALIGAILPRSICWSSPVKMQLLGATILKVDTWQGDPDEEYAKLPAERDLLVGSPRGEGPSVAFDREAMRERRMELCVCTAERVRVCLQTEDPFDGSSDDLEFVTADIWGRLAI